MKDGNYGITYLPKKLYANLRRLSMFRAQLLGDRGRNTTGIGGNILAGILAEMRDISRFDGVEKIQKLSGMGLAASSSGKHKGQTKISRRGRKRLRYWLFQATKSAVAHTPEFKKLHVYYTTRAANPLKKLQSLIVISCKILRSIYSILKTGTKYDPEKMLMDIKYPENALKPTEV